MLNTKNVRIYFEDAYCAVIYKAIGEDSQTFFTDFFPHKSFVAPVNRLDIPVSGMLLLAFSPQIQTILSNAFNKQLVIKEYWAVCERSTPQSVEPDVFYRLIHTIGFNAQQQKAFVSSNAHLPASKRSTVKLKQAILNWKLCGSGEHYDFIQIFPETGRTHQIRIQMAHIGRPIKGDIKYGARRSEKNGGIRLHCSGMQFMHPVTGKLLVFEAEPQPQDTLWSACIQACSPRRGKLPEQKISCAVADILQNQREPTNEKT